MKGRDLALYHVTYSNVILQTDPAPNVNDFGHYMKSYKKYILSKFAIILLPGIIFDSDYKYVQKCSRNYTANKKNSSFELKMD